MPEKQLPARPDLEQYKKQAKELARACRNADPDALARLRAHHPRRKSGTNLPLADAQLVLAREHGYTSWDAFVAAIGMAVIAARVAALGEPNDAFLRAAVVPRDASHVSGTIEEAMAILAHHPGAGYASIYAAAAMGNEPAVREFMAGDPSLATATGGPYQWDALSYLCFSRFLRHDVSDPSPFVAAARALLDAGANPNTGWYERPDYEGGKPVWESALYGAAGVAHHAGLTQLLLDRGANPNDGETPYHAPESYDNTVLEILLKSGKVDERGKAWILCRKADWHDYDGMRLALDYHCDPNFIPHWGSSALQHAFLRDNRIEIIQLLLDHGADPLLPNNKDGANAVQMAALRGRGDVLKLFAERGHDLNLQGVDRLIAACALADRAQIATLTENEPALRAALLKQGGDLLGTFAGVGNTHGVRCLLDLGVPADALYAGDAYFGTPGSSTALHVAAWRGQPETMRLLIERGAPPDARDGKGRTALQLAIRTCADSYWKQRRIPEWIQPLLVAGASTDGIEIPTGYPEADALLHRYNGTK
jgi:ankyrin repeat protein